MFEDVFVYLRTETLNMQANIAQIILCCCATAELLAACVMAVYARHRVQYLSLAWVNGILGFILLGETFIADIIVTFPSGILNPIILLAFLAGVFLQSIYPLSIPMPGFLQWRRMWNYALPIIVLFAVYALTLPFTGGIVLFESWKEVSENIFTVDVLCRLAAVGLSFYYITNIFRLPKQMVRHANVPRYLLGYCTALGMSVLFYLYVILFYDVKLLIIYHLIFTILNLYLVFRTLETIALELPLPALETVETAPDEAEVEKAEREDFNEANLQRFHRVEYWMQNHRDAWTDSSFGRDRLCLEVGYNRHLLLQCLRSQGYNNIHDYISRYRVEELKRLIQRGQVQSANEAADAGFGTSKTARNCFQRMEGTSLDAYLERHNK